MCLFSFGYMHMTNQSRNQSMESTIVYKKYWFSHTHQVKMRQLARLMPETLYLCIIIYGAVSICLWRVGPNQQLYSHFFAKNMGQLLSLSLPPSSLGNLFAWSINKQTYSARQIFLFFLHEQQNLGQLILYLFHEKIITYSGSLSYTIFGFRESPRSSKIVYLK